MLGSASAEWIKGKRRRSNLSYGVSSHVPSCEANFATKPYVQRLRIEDARRRLERTEASVDEIAWQVGYEEAAFFRRLFRRTTGLSPAAYRKRFRTPDFMRAR